MPPAPMLVRAGLRPAAGRIVPFLRVSSSIRRRLSCMTISLDPSKHSPSEESAAALKKAAAQQVANVLPLCLPPRGADLTSEYTRLAAERDDAAVIVVSRSLAHCLDDPDFLPTMLVAAGLTESGVPKALTVVAAVADEVPLYELGMEFFCSGEGVSILRGTRSRLLPGLLEGDSLKVSSDVQGQKPSLVFEPPPCRYAGPLTVTVPLANTLFSTGRPHMLFASRWKTEPSGPPRLLEQREITSQTVVLTAQDMAFEQQSVSSVLSCLIPLTRPYKIAAGLGNILRGIEVSGQPKPASDPLERGIPHLLEFRRHAHQNRQAQLPRAFRDEDGQGPNSGPVGVWALLIPPKYVQAGLPILSDLDSPRDQREWKAAKDTADKVDMLLAAGCQLRKVLSGGGGWGNKQGLLALDPETRLTTDEHQDLESFIDSFEHRGKKGRSTGGIVTPGSYVQFFVEPVLPSSYSAPWFPLQQEPLRPSKWPTTVFGTPGTPITSQPTMAWRNLFGAISSEGVYVSQKSVSQNNKAAKGPAIATKLDAPRSYIVSSERFRSHLGRTIQGNLYNHIPLVRHFLEARKIENAGRTAKALKTAKALYTAKRHSQRFFPGSVDKPRDGVGQRT